MCSVGIHSLYLTSLVRSVREREDRYPRISYVTGPHYQMCLPVDLKFSIFLREDNVILTLFSLCICNPVYSFSLLLACCHPSVAPRLVIYKGYMASVLCFYSLVPLRVTTPIGGVGSTSVASHNFAIYFK